MAQEITVNVDIFLYVTRTYDVTVPLADGETVDDAADRVYKEALKDAYVVAETIVPPDGFNVGDVEVETY